jgi:glycyl-tRNA synthetase beta chain
LFARAAEPFASSASFEEATGPLHGFMADRLAYLLEQRGFDVRNVRAVMAGDIEHISPLEARQKLEALAQMSGSQALLGVAGLLKRVKNITKTVAPGQTLDPEALSGVLTEPAEVALLQRVQESAPAIRAAAAAGNYHEAFTAIAGLQPAVAKFFDDVLVMTDDEQLRAARLALVAALRDLILDIADLSEMASD